MSQLEIHKAVGFRTQLKLWYRFKAKCYESGLEVSRVLTTMIRLFVEDEKFRQAVLEQLDPKVIA
ncbi:MAG: hypothetical protein GXO43_02150 [Crenarchaeota archaeon]|nr:hypothetical protein [Thermoproteota archaeon]